MEGEIGHIDTQNGINLNLHENQKCEIENQHQEEAGFEGEDFNKMNFEEIKKNHMQMMNNIDINDFDNHRKTNNNNYWNNNFDFNNSNASFNNNQANLACNMLVQPPAYPPRIFPMQPFNLNINSNINPMPNPYGTNNLPPFYQMNPFTFFNSNNNASNYKADKSKPYLFVFSNTILTNPSLNQKQKSFSSDGNNNISNANKDNNNTENKNMNEEVDFTKMTRFNIKFQNPFNGRINQTDILIETKYAKEFGEFHKEWKEKITPIEQTIPNTNNKITVGFNITWNNERLQKTVAISPIFILLALIDEKIDHSLVPESWKFCKINDDYIKIKFKNKKILYLNKHTRSLCDKIPKKADNKIAHNFFAYSNINADNSRSINLKIIPETQENKVSFLNEFENEDDKNEKAKILKEQEKEIEEKKKKEKKLLSKLLGNKHFLLKENNEYNSKKKNKAENDSDAESEENIIDNMEVDNRDNNLTLAELKFKYASEIKLYKELMQEKNITILSKYSEVLPQLIYDPRYLKIPKKLRERIFDEYVREKEAEDFQKIQLEKNKEYESEKSLLDNDHNKNLLNNMTKEEQINTQPDNLTQDNIDIRSIQKANMTSNTSMIMNINNGNISETSKNKSSDIFDLKNLENMMDKKAKEKIKEKQNDNREKNMRKISQNKLKALIKAQIESGVINSNTPYAEFERLNFDNEDFQNSLQIDREFLFNEAKLKVKKILEERKKADVKKFKDMLYSKVDPTIITQTTSAKQIKKLIKREIEYKLISSKQERMEIIKDFISEIQKLISHTKNLGEIISNKKDIEIKIAEEDYRKFLFENIKFEISWEEANKKFSNNNIFNDPNLTAEKRMTLFKDFIFTMKETKKKLLRDLFEEKIGLNQDITWHETQHMLQNEKKFRDVIDNDRELLFNEYKAYVQQQVLSEFHQFLAETPLVTKDSPIEGQLFMNLIAKLNSDTRFQRLGRNPDKRDKFLREKIKNLKYEFEKKERNERKKMQGYQSKGYNDRNNDNYHLKNRSGNTFDNDKFDHDKRNINDDETHRSREKDWKEAKHDRK